MRRDDDGLGTGDALHVPDTGRDGVGVGHGFGRPEASGIEREQAAAFSLAHVEAAAIGRERHARGDDGEFGAHGKRDFAGGGVDVEGVDPLGGA